MVNLIRRLSGWAILAMSIVLPLIFQPALAQPYPSKPVEFVAHSGPGGGPDVFARAVTEIIAREKLLRQPAIVANRTGGAGTVALNYIRSKRGDPHSVLTVATGTLMTAASRTDLDLGLEHYTPLAFFALDPQTITVRADSKVTTFRELLEAARREPNTITAGIGGPEDLAGKRVVVTKGSTAAKVVGGLRAEAVEFSKIDEVYQALHDKSVDAVVFDSPVLMHYAANEGKGRVTLVGPPFGKEDYGIVFPQGSKWLPITNVALLRIKEDGTYQRLHEKWFGVAK